jgi:proline iminopeptidase
MFVSVNETRLFFDVVGSKLDPIILASGVKPTLIALHGGPGFDHQTLRPYFDRFSDIAQIIYLDQRGNGRSIGSPPESWTLSQWGDDIKTFCDVLGIERPIVMGQSFGGFVAQSYAVRHPTHPSALILSSTAARMNLNEVAARIELAGGPETRSIAEQMWTLADEASQIEYAKVVLLLYAASDKLASSSSKTIKRYDVAGHFYRAPDGEIRQFDFRSALSAVRCPTLILSGGEGDLITPPSSAKEIAASLPSGLAKLECLLHCRHGTFRDDPETTEKILRSFITTIPINIGLDISSGG